MSAQKLVVNLNEVDKGDIPLVGGKGANLGEMVKAGFPVPPGFAVTVWAYDLFLTENGIVEKIDGILSGINPESSEELENASRSIQKLVSSSKVPQGVANEVIKSYKKLSPGIFRKARVAVRSSATAEDLPGASFAGQQASFLNVIGDANLLEALRSCWASLFTPRAIFYRIEQKIAHKKVKISVIVQKMVQAESSGVMFSIDPVTNNKERIVIESVWGLGEMIVQGSVVPDKYTVQKGTFEILYKTISDQDKALVRKGTGNIEINLDSKKIGAQKITDEEVKKLAKISDQLQRHYYFPQDTEWAKENGKLYIVQTRPITTLNSQSKVLDIQKSKAEGDVKTPILTGAAASPGFGTGPVRILKDAKEIGKVKLGDVLVAPMTSPDFVPAMKKAKAIITDQGGQTSHAAIVSRELGIPCVVGTKVATKVLEEGSVVTVDGKTGRVYTGDFVSTEKETKLKPMKGKTATKVYVNLGEPEMAEKVSKLNVDGVGLLRAEFMIANIGIHPREAIQRRKQRDFIDKLTQGLTHFCKSFYPRPVVYRATDFKTNEYRSLPGGKAWEPEEPNPMLGFRGAARYIANPEVFNLEIQAIKEVRK